MKKGFGMKIRGEETTGTVRAPWAASLLPPAGPTTNLRKLTLSSRITRAIRYATGMLGWVLLASAAALSQIAPSPSGRQGEAAQPDAGELLKKVGETYRAMSTLQGEVTMAVETGDPALPEQTEMPFSLSINAKGKMRMEGKGLVPVTTVADGQTLWVYMPLFNRYMKIPLGQSGTYAAPGFTVPSDYLQQFSKVGENVKAANIVGAETLHVNGSDVSCWIVSANYDSPNARAAPAAGGAKGGALSGTTKLWVDKTRYWVYRESSEVEVPAPGTAAPNKIKNTISFTRLAINEAIPDSAFVFQPPAGASEMDPAIFLQQTPAPN